MARLYFKKQFHDSIARGRKTTTLRRWRTCRVKAGARVLSPGLGWLEIVSAEPIEWEELTESHARADGFSSISELRATVGKIYPNLDVDGKSWFLVSFRHDPSLQSSPPKAPRELKRRPPGARPATDEQARKALAERILAELDKASGATGSCSDL